MVTYLLKNTTGC